jgi:hypothetical protein
MRKSFLLLVIMILDFPVFSQKGDHAGEGIRENVSIEYNTYLWTSKGKGNMVKLVVKLK